MKKYVIGLLSILFCLSAKAQQQVEMADGMRQQGKIYIVVVVCLTILIGLFLFVVRLDRKISRLEKKNGTTL